ncbi:hypothetical protein C8D87_11862 [Lentzea atacamensis]|uniref:Uncharacterized protein n=1 Tax=Lentzea atacamensis TaxID=531938 RepID=A0ABX9DY04_9PSEU|nr:hypothetical protein C8D87_11862 [Lentzea atacamensis]
MKIGGTQSAFGLVGPGDDRRSAVRPQDRVHGPRGPSRAAGTASAGARRPPARHRQLPGCAAQRSWSDARHRCHARRDPPAADDHQAGPVGPLPVRAAAGAAGGRRVRARVVWHGWAADAHSLHRQRCRGLGRGHGQGARGCGRHQELDHPQRLRLRAFHGWARGAPRWPQAAGDGHSHVRRYDGAAGQAHRGPEAGCPLLHAVVRAAAGGRPRQGQQHRGRHLRRRAVDRGDAPRDRAATEHQGARHLRTVRSDRSGRGV